MFGGGNGESFEAAVVINTDHSDLGIQAEYMFVAGQCGEPGVAWTLDGQELQGQNEKPYDVLRVKLSNGELRTFYFDISQFFVK